jgi:hypothetical protein
MERLKESGLTGLEDSDTLYMPQTNPPSDQPLTIVSGSTRATLAADTTAVRQADSAIVSLTAGTPLTLADGTTVTVPAHTVVSHTDGTVSNLSADTPFPLPGQIPVSSSSGIQIAGTDTVVPDFTAVTLPSGAVSAVLAYDGSQVNLPNGTAVVIRSGLPQPFFYEEIFNSTSYNPSNWVQEPYPVKNLDFSFDGAYSNYNWDLFCHFHHTVGVHLCQNHKFQDAQRWFHFVFNPTDNSPGPTPERFWGVQPFQYTDVRLLQDILVNLSTHQDPELFQQTVDSITYWKQNPFQPWAVAKFRPSAYMLKIVMSYLDNLIAWHDSLRQQPSIEAIVESIQIIVLAANILGPKPQAVPKKGSVKPLTYNDIRGKLDDFGNALVDMEVDIPFDVTLPSGSGTSPTGAQILPNIGQTLYFCIPRNDKLLAYWDTVADRLFKIHNSLNLQGVFQQLPLFDPPIDPALLVRAAASGLDVSAIVSGLNQPLPLVRFQLLVSKAAEICQEVKSLGANLLAAIEKQDNEAISLLRAQHENAILGLANTVKYSQWQDAIKAGQALGLSLDNATRRYSYYQKLLGRTDQQIAESIPELKALDKDTLLNMNFTQTDINGEPQMTLYLPIDPKIPNDAAQSAASSLDGGIKTLSNSEVGELMFLEEAIDKQSSAASSESQAGMWGLIPDFAINLEPFGIGSSTTLGGTYAAKFPQADAREAHHAADLFTYDANKTAKLGSYSRRELEWTFQSNSAESEINQIFKQIPAAQIREAIAKQEYDNHQTQMENARQIVDFLQGKFKSDDVPIKETTTGFYLLMKRDVKGLYARAFQLAFEVAKKAERALQHELGDPSLSFIQFNYLDGNEGLLAGEKLLFDVKTMEMAYHDLNQREYELTKHASLRQIDPLALVQLRATGSCGFTIPEEAFDLDCPGHYFRRIKSVAVTLPCVTGPYTGVNCTLTMQKGTIRTSTALPGNKYARQGSDDTRFDDYYGAMQSIVTSSGQSDSGMFETNLRDERYLPFEGAGIAGSQWQLTLPSDVRQIDFDTITDVVLQFLYTARPAGAVLKTAAVSNLQALINKAQTVGSVCLFSVRHEFPSQWAKFQSVTINSTTPTAELRLALVPELYPFWAQGIVGVGLVKSVAFFAEMPATDKTAAISINDKPDKSGKPPDTLARNPLMGNLLGGALESITRPSAITDANSPMTLYFDNNSMNDLWLAITWGK